VEAADGSFSWSGAAGTAYADGTLASHWRGAVARL